MKKLILVSLLVALSFAGFTADPPRAPFVVLRVNGQEYAPNSEIGVRSGERIQVEAVLMGGKRDYCSNPNKYANVGKTMVIESSGENGISFNVNGGQFRGDWRLADEKATFTSGPEVVITPTPSGNLSRSAKVEFKPGNYSKMFFKVSSVANWHYVRVTPAGKTEQDEKNEGTSTFNFVIEAKSGVWFSSNNISASGSEDFSVRSNLTRIQEAYNQIEKALIAKNFSSARMQLGNLKASLGELPKLIDKAKEKDPKFSCEITLIGLPTDVPMQHIGKLETLSGKYKEGFDISQANAMEINKMLLNTQMTFSSNVLRSIFKNYINWGTSIPLGVEDLLSIYDPKNIFTPLDLPRKIMSWYEDANNDAGILKDQANNIKNLSELRTYYLKRVESFVKERQALTDIIKELNPVKEINTEAEGVIKSQKGAKYTPKSK
jgi:lipoprotein-anchoring transpeptidase ErfK/SrfK